MGNYAFKNISKES